MKKINFPLISFFLLITQNVSAQFNPDLSNNYFDEKEKWTNYFDSVHTALTAIGDSSMKGTGLKEFRNWKAYWDNIMPNTGDYNDAQNMHQELLDFQKIQHHNHNLQVQSNSTAFDPMAWSQIGPKNMSEILTKSGSNWIQAHSLGSGNIKSGMHVAKVDRLYQHPTIDNIIYTIGGEIDNSGGGLFVSHDSGLNWEVMGTDFIPKLNISSFAIKPIGIAPETSKEIIFIGLTSGSMYRSVDAGLTWIECNFHGSSPYPFNYGQNPLDPFSLPNYAYSFSFYNGEDVKNGEATFTKKDANSGDYSRLILTREDGVYYSDNYEASIAILSNQVINQMKWKKFDMSAIEAQIPTYFTGSTLRINYMEFEQFQTGTGPFSYLVYLQVFEQNSSGDTLGLTRQYILRSNSYGANWYFLGGSPTVGAQGLEIYNKGFISGHIEVNK